MQNEKRIVVNVSNITYCNVKESFSKDRKECTPKAYVCAWSKGYANGKPITDAEYFSHLSISWSSVPGKGWTTKWIEVIIDSQFTHAPHERRIVLLLYTKFYSTTAEWYSAMFLLYCYVFINADMARYAWCAFLKVSFALCKNHGHGIYSKTIPCWYFWCRAYRGWTVNCHAHSW